MYFDTLSASKSLQQAGMEETQAEAVVMAIKSSQGDLATKNDIAMLKSDIDSLQNLLEGKINDLRWTMVVVGGIIVALVKFLP